MTETRSDVVCVCKNCKEIMMVPVPKFLSRVPEPSDEQIWMEYAKGALAGNILLLKPNNSKGLSGTTICIDEYYSYPDSASMVADKMLSEHKKRWSK